MLQRFDNFINRPVDRCEYIGNILMKPAQIGFGGSTVEIHSNGQEVNIEKKETNLLLRLSCIGVSVIFSPIVIPCTLAGFVFKLGSNTYKESLGVTSQINNYYQNVKSNIYDENINSNKIKIDNETLRLTILKNTYNLDSSKVPTNLLIDLFESTEPSKIELESLACMACYHKDKVLFSYIIKKMNSDSLFKFNHGRSMLHMACLFEDVDTVRYLIEKEVHINTLTQKDGKSALHLAVENNNLDIVKELLKAGALSTRATNMVTLTGFSRVILDNINVSNSLAILKETIDLLGKLSTNSLDIKTTKFLIDLFELQKEQLSPDDLEEAFKIACRDKNEVLFEYLDTKMDLVDYCIESEKYELFIGIPYLMNKIVQKIDYNNGSSLYKLILSEISKGNHEDSYARFLFKTARDLIERHPSLINITGNKGNTILHIACISENFDLFRWLLGKKANLNAKTEEGETPLNIAVRKNNVYIVKELIEEGASISANAKNGMTAANFARDLLNQADYESSLVLNEIIDFIESYEITKRFNELGAAARTACKNQTFDAFYKICSLMKLLNEMPDPPQNSRKFCIDAGATLILKQMEDENKDELTCPISLATSNDFVAASDGGIYDRGSIQEWLSSHLISPLNRQPVDKNSLVSIPKEILNKVTEEKLKKVPLEKLNMEFKVVEAACQLKEHDAFFKLCRLLEKIEKMPNSQFLEDISKQLIELGAGIIQNQIQDKEEVELTCAISYETSEDFVIAADGGIYDRAQILQFLNKSKISPLTREPLDEKGLVSIPKVILDQINK